jgi:hypothetical protein
MTKYFKWVTVTDFFGGCVYIVVGEKSRRSATVENCPELRKGFE